MIFSIASNDRRTKDCGTKDCGAMGSNTKDHDLTGGVPIGTDR